VPVDELEHHLEEAGSIERALVPMGMYMAWCANLHLLAPGFQNAHESVLLRLRFRELSPCEFLVATGEGSIRLEDLNEEGRTFTRAYYEDYLEDFRNTFDGDIYSVTDDWAHYERIATILTRRFMTMKNGTRHSGGNGRAGKKWWQVWR